MEWETFIQSVLTLLGDGKNICFVLYAVSACLLTQLIKKIAVNKVKVEVFKKFNVAVILPFVFGLVFAAVDALFINKPVQWTWYEVYNVAVDAMAIGAMSTVIFRCVSAIGGQRLDSLLKDEVFGCCYTQMVYFCSVRQQLADGKLSMKDFLAQVKLVADNAKTIYQSEDTAEAKRRRLNQLLEGIFTDDSVATVLDTLHGALLKVTDNKTK
ncbi:MAG: hypothetical protein NC350_05440 [Corallococcus sp.]|nr:hypothetical protein [Corallococcus sp.]